MSAAAAELDALLARGVDEVLAEQRSYWRRAVAANPASVVLFGAGRLGRRTLAGMRKAGLADPLAFADNSRQLHGTLMDGIPVRSPEEAVLRHAEAAFVVATYNTSRPRAQLAALGVRALPYAWLFAAHPGAFLPHLCLDHPARILEAADAVRQGFALMNGSASREAYLRQVRWRLFLDFDRVIAPQTPELRDSEYFPDDIYDYHEREVLVDCGAFDGDTVRRFLGKRGDAFARVHACEPDAGNRQRFAGWASTLAPSVRERIRLEPVAIDAKAGTARFASTGTAGSAIDDAGRDEVTVTTIDALTAGQPPTLIKMDVEGAELNALEGARRSITESTPVLAICVYHAADHLWKVPLAIASMSSRYRFYLRAHAEDCWDVSCYAVPEGRAKMKTP